MNKFFTIGCISICTMHIAYNASAATLNTITLYCGGNPADNTTYIRYESVSCRTVRTAEDKTLMGDESFICLDNASNLTYRKYTCNHSYSGSSEYETFYFVSDSYVQNCQAGTFDWAGNCIECAVATDNQDSTSDTGATDITDCYIPSTSSFSDDVGTYMYASNCYYDGEYNGTDASSSTTS
ncbi:MAG: hypothetical protein J6L70_02605 [Alphaproteobacteria bacterium]|nr:hypothetical protein [Alphaproteobacteria bacterium]